MADQVILPLLNPRGVYSASVVYNPNDLVTYNGVPYYCRIGTIAGQPITPGSDPNTWQLLNTPGADGEKGDQGIQGEQGPRGRQGLAGPSGAGYKPRGEWNATTTYQAADSVTRYVPAQGTGVWFAIKDNTNVTPGTDATVWASGIKGDTGDVTPEALAARDDAADSAAAALASQNAAKTSEMNSKTSETNADTSKQAAAASATAADTSKQAAAASATAADTSKQAAAASATAADTSKQAAAGSATAASNSAAAALASQNAAKTSETNSKTSETNSAASAAAAQAAAQSVGTPVSKLGDTMTGDLWVGDPASTAGKTLGTNYRVGIARNSVGGVPYQVITNGQNVLATPPAAQASIGQILYRWASTTSDVLAGQSAVELNGYANTDGSGSFAIRTRNAANAVLGNLWLAANRLIFGTSIDDGATPVQINPAGVTSPVLNAPTMRVIDSGNGTAGGLSVEAFQPLIQFIDRSASTKNSRMMQNAGQISFANDPGDGSGAWTAPGAVLNPDGAMVVGAGASLSNNVGFYANGANIGTGTSQWGFYSSMEFNEASTTGGYSFASKPKTKAATYTVANLVGFNAEAPVVGAGSTITAYTAFRAMDFSTAGTIYGFRGQMASGAGKWNLYIDGSAINYMNGALLIGTTTDNGTDKLQSAGSALFTGGVGVNGAATTYRGVNYKTANKLRWAHGANQSAESTGNVGSDFSIDRYDDTGTWIDSPVSIVRSTGIMNLLKRPTFNGNTPWDSGNLNFATPPAIGLTTPAAGKFTTLSTTAGIASASTVQVGPGPGAATSFVTPTAVFATKTGNTSSNDNYTEMWHDGTTGGIWIGGGSAATSKGLITATGAQIASGIPQILGRNGVVLHSHWSGHSSTPSTPSAAINCYAAWLSTGRLRIYLNTAFGFATHAIVISGTNASNGTNWCVVSMIGNAGDGTFIDIGCVITGSGAGAAVEMQMQCTVLKVA